MTLDITPKNAALGAEIRGVDLGQPVSADIAASIKTALCEHGVLNFPEQDLTPEAQVALTRHLGEPEVHVLSEFALPDMPEVFIVSNVRKDGKPIGAINAGQYWHSDISYTPRPTFASMLYAKQIPAAGGETLFANMIRAYEALPANLRERIQGRTAVHDYALAYETVFADNPDRSLSDEKRAQVPPVEHPVVRTQVETGRKALYINPGFTRYIVGLDAEESQEILETLFEYAEDDSNVYTHHWQEGDLVVWDNRITMHKALSNYGPGDVRYMLRTSVTGEVPV